MMELNPIVDDNDVDDHVDDQIIECLTLEIPKSFFLFAGAGSGKTESLVIALKRLREVSGNRLRLRGQHIGVITYTNAACNEITRRLDFDPLVEVSTIHSFSWSLIGGFHSDIKVWLKSNLVSEITELEEKQRKGRGGKAALDREKSIETKKRRLTDLDDIKRFTYNPNGENRERDSLSHSEVIAIVSDFLTQKPLMQSILINKYPILLIDESQDTIKSLMDAFLDIQRQHVNHFALGLFGDTMQRIYGHGKMDLGQNLPADWMKPAKIMNHRSPRRIIKLINKIRSAVDDQKQTPRSDKEEGFVRLFIFNSDTTDKTTSEHEAAQRMATITGDPLWCGSDAEVKTLTLEHHMAAKRMGFLEMYEPLYKVSRLRTSILDGSLPGLRIFSETIFPLVKAKQEKNDFAVAAIALKASPLLRKSFLKAAGEDQPLQIKKTREEIDKLLTLWSEGKEPRFLDILRSIAQTGLFEIPESLRPIAVRSEEEQQIAETLVDIEQPEKDDAVYELNAWDKFLLTPFAQIEPYAEYVSRQAPFDTHQGVKGLEFPRVMVIIDDEEALGFMFSYDKLFGAKDKTETDLKNESQGNDTSIDRTRRLFYTTCSRAEKSLAIIAYSTDPEKVRDHVLSEGWFEDTEVEFIT